MWEPFSVPARRTIQRAHEVAQLFAAPSVGTAHLAFALAETDDGTGQAFAAALDRDAIRVRLGSARGAPQTEMSFSAAAKRSIECAFINARRLKQSFIGSAHLALGVLDSGDLPPLATGAQLSDLRTALIAAAIADTDPTMPR